MRFLLVHGGWQGSWCWDGVAERLRAAGHEVLAPTLAGHEPGATGRTDLTATELARRLADEERVYDLLPAPLAESLQAAAGASAERLIPMPPEFWVHGLCNDMPEEEANRWLERVVPTPDGWMSDPVRLPSFAGRTVPASYVFLADDVAVDRSVYQACAGRLGQSATATAPGAHEAMLSQPGPLADALLEVCR